MTGLSVGLTFDLRNPAPAQRDVEDLTAEVLTQIVRAEALGFGSICAELLPALAGGRG